MKLLVTGAAGFLGRAVIERLVAHGFNDIRCNVRRRAYIPSLDALLGRYPHVNLEYCVGNLRYRDDAARAANDVELIFHLAAGKRGTAADLFLDSVVASRNLLDAVGNRKPMRIVLVSSFSVYGVAVHSRGTLVNEQTVLEAHPEWRDHYSFAKLRQEQLFWEYQLRHGFELVVLRPGVIYGPGGSHFSNRVGLKIGKWLLNFGGNNSLPLSYVDNCAEAVVVAGIHPSTAGQVYNVHDHDLPTCREYLCAYRKHVTHIQSISLPYFCVQLLSRMVAKYHRYSNGQLPAFLTPYRAACMWGGSRFENSKLCSIGWRQLVSTAEGLQRSFSAFRCGLEADRVEKKVPPIVAANPTDAPLKELRRSSGELVVGAILGPDPNGSFDQLLAAISNLRSVAYPAKLIIFGVRDAKQFKDKAAIRERNPEVQWVLDELGTRELLEGCDVLVSLQDGVPLMVLQAMSLRIPIITTAVRAPEALRNQPEVRFIGHGDKNGIQEALVQLSEQPNAKLILGNVSEGNIAKYYSDTYLWRENCSQTPDGHAPKWHALIKKALFSVVPDRLLVAHGNRDRAQIALTIDDGPDPVYTPRVLDIFRDHAVKATFFVVGGAAEQYPDIVVRIKEEGHEIGCHSYSHPYFHRLSWIGAIREIKMTRWVLDRILGEECKLFRPPHGKLSLRSLIPAWAVGQHVVMWNVDLKDFRASKGEVEARVDRTSFSSGDIILYHGINEAALKALPHVIKAALGKRREAVTISEFIRQ